jgi:hypothetical protein
MTLPKLTQEDCKTIIKLLKQGVSAKELSKKYGVSKSTIYRRVKYPYQSRYIPLEIKNKIIKKIKEGYGKAEAAQMYGIPVNTVLWFTKGMPGHKSEGDHIIRKHGIELLNRLLKDGYLVSNFVVSTARGLQKHFPMICCARFKEKTFFYLRGRERDAIEGYFKERPDRVINYSAIEELSFLLGVKISKDDQKNLIEKYKKKHDHYWRSRRLIQRRLEDFYSEDELYDQEWAEPSFRLMPRRNW